MQKLYNKLKNYTLKNALEIEKSDLQYKALEKLFIKIKNEELFYSLILANSIICYQLSSTGEKYWEEFSTKSGEYFQESDNIKSKEIILFFTHFLPNSRGNKRFIETKIKRLKKIEIFLDIFIKKHKYYVENFNNLINELAKNLNQKKDAKTIVFSVKMLWYGINIIYENSKNKNGLTIPNSKIISSIQIPIDSRLIKIFEKYKENYRDIKIFYSDLSKKLNIPELNLDAIIWVNFEKLMN